ncbi:hypothetical protein Glove_86g52 [Diversispora epigaea]|uniref:Uncharacterized protein n=1 Tax=Diversispora epigaea TaxID=1348612 RepID=A0A397J8T7_9GLOM|nr:hypothetical protein Glove_86g52 [Diversispora epigaea]
MADINVIRQLKIAGENQKNTSKSQKQELFSHSTTISSVNAHNIGEETEIQNK